MFDGRKLLIAVIGGLLITATADADMVSVFELDAGRHQEVSTCSQPETPPTDLSCPFNQPSFVDLDMLSVRFLPQANAHVIQTYETRHALDLTNEPGSYSLCLYALIGLGLCNSVHWVKKISLGFIPEWYHDGGPFQIGHSYAVTPESLYPAPAYCFIQPVWAVEDSLPQYRLRTIVSSWRKSQFTPDVIASRGPPLS